MMRALIATCGLLGLAATPTFARGVSPYLPINIDPSIERQVERILILADKPVLKRPIAAAAVLDALPVACKKDPLLCQEVRRYLGRYMRDWSVTEATAEVSASNGSEKTLPNRYGQTSASNWDASVRAQWQPLDHALVSLGAVAYDGEIVPDGSLVSLGFDRAQLDLGYRAHWLSPLTDSSMLLSTQAATMPSVTISNYVPLTRWGFGYEAFIAGMSKSDHILYGGKETTGYPRLAGVHLSTEPASGWAIGLNRVLQYGGGERPSSFSDLIHAFFSPSRYDNTNPGLTSDQQFGNQVASVTSQFMFPGKVPFTIYFEYAGEDTSNGSNYLLGNAALSAGIHFAHLWRRFDLTYEVSEWQNSWYVNGVYGDGLTNKGHVLGHWAGDERLLGDGVGGQSHMVRLGWEPSFGGLVEMRLRTLANESYGVGRYERAYDGMARYSRSFGSFRAGVEAFGGRDVFGDTFSRIAAFVSYDEEADSLFGRFVDVEPPTAADPTAELFVQAGAATNRVRIDLDATTPAYTKSSTGPHFAVGALRAVSDRSDLGARVEFDEVDGHSLVSVRAIDYRYRFHNPLAVSVFVGASRYSLATPAYGISYGAGLQWRNVAPGWDIGVDARVAKKVARDNLVAGDPVTVGDRTDTFYDIYSATLSVTRRF